MSNDILPIIARVSTHELEAMLASEWSEFSWMDFDRDYWYNAEQAIYSLRLITAIDAELDARGVIPRAMNAVTAPKPEGARSEGFTAERA